MIAFTKENGPKIWTSVDHINVSQVVMTIMHSRGISGLT
jgi:hypothetical protein